MRVGIIAPNYHPAVSGNAVTVRRIVRHLELLGCEVRVFPVDHLVEQLLAEIRSFAPQLLHAFHGYQGGRVAQALARTLQIPYLVTLTGTDVYQALDDQRSTDTHAALRGAARLVAFHASVKRRLADHLPTLEERTVVIPQGVEVSSCATPGGEKQTFTFLLPAGLRPVKNNLFPLKPLADLHDRYPQIRLKLVGPVIDTAYAKEVMDALEEYPFASYLGAVGHEAIWELYRQADVVLNCSQFEGGMANSVLEGLACGKALLVSDIEGNRSVVKDGVTGFLYRDAAEFVAKGAELVTDPLLRERLGKHGIGFAHERFRPEKEAQAYLDLYQAILQG